VPDQRLSALEKELRARPPEGLRQLDAAALDDLAAAVAAARRRQAVELQAAGEQALRHIPRVLRGPVLRIFR